MPALSGLMVAALGLLAAIVVYFLAWRATAHRSIGTQALVRGGLFVLLAVPLAAVFLLSPTMHRAFDKREPQLSSPLDDEAPPVPTAKSDAKPRGRLGDPADGSSPPLATMAQESAWDVVPVFFGTDREE